jgi:hypothetical protein
MRKVKNSEILGISIAIAEFEKLIEKNTFKLSYALSKHKDVILRPENLVEIKHKLTDPKTISTVSSISLIF